MNATPIPNLPTKDIERIQRWRDGEKCGILTWSRDALKAEETAALDRLAQCSDAELPAKRAAWVQARDASKLLMTEEAAVKSLEEKLRTQA